VRALRAENAKLRRQLGRSTSYTVVAVLADGVVVRDTAGREHVIEVGGAIK